MHNDVYAKNVQLFIITSMASFSIHTHTREASYPTLEYKRGILRLSNSFLQLISCTHLTLRDINSDLHLSIILFVMSLRYHITHLSRLTFTPICMYISFSSISVAHCSYTYNIATRSSSLLKLFVQSFIISFILRVRYQSVGAGLP